MRIRINLTLATILAASSVNATAALAQSFRFCIGEKRCPVSAQSLHPCGSSVDKIAEDYCTIRLGGGQTKVLPHHLISEGSKGGHRCGYSWYVVTCRNN
jgi:hypothetical protein